MLTIPFSSQHHDGRERDANGRAALPDGGHEDLPLPDAVHCGGGSGKLQPAAAAPQRGAAPPLLKAHSPGEKEKKKGTRRIRRIENNFL